MCQFFMIVIIAVLCICSHSITSATDNQLSNSSLQANSTKVFVDHQGNVVPHPGMPGVRPTSLPVYHKPGEPPKEGNNRPTNVNSELATDRPGTITNRPGVGSSTGSNQFGNKPSKPPKPSKPGQEEGNKPFDPLSWLGSIFGHSTKNTTNKLPEYVFESEFHITTVLPDFSYSKGNSTILVKPAPLSMTVTYSNITSHNVIFDVLPLSANTAQRSTTINPDVITFSTPMIDNASTAQSGALFYRPNNTNVSSAEVSSGQNSTDPNKGIIDWVLSAFGINNGNNNNNNNSPPPPVQPPKNCEPCSCGQSFKHTRIVGGVETQVNAYPWMTLLTYNGRFYCGATVINNKYLVTATHCVNGFAKERLEATFLDHDRSTPFETATFTRRISAVLKHRGYNQGYSYNNDISLLKLDQDLPMQGLLTPVCLPIIGKSYTGYNGIVTGWGATEAHGSVSNRLREVEVPILSNIDCRNTGYGSKITDNMMCAGFKHGTKDSCQGDSGGPLHVVNSSSHTIIGIVSWGEGCAEPNYPGVYTRVNRYISWIRSNTRDACYCEIIK